MDEMVERPTRRGVTDDEHPLTLPMAQGHAGNTDPSDRFPPALPIRTWDIDMLLMPKLAHGRSVHEAVVALTQPPIMQHGDVDIRERDRDVSRARARSEVRMRDNPSPRPHGDAHPIASLDRVRLGRGARGPLRRDPILVVLRRGVGLEDDVHVHGYVSEAAMARSAALR
jgi:hypothetical protein